MRILVAEDVAKMAKHIRQGLEAEGYAVDVAADGDEAQWLAETQDYDVIVMDVMLPARDGFTVARQLRRKQNPVPILFLSCRADVEDRVRGLDAGGDDYLTKPFSMAELLARLRALLRRQRPQLTNALRVADLELDLLARRATRGGNARRAHPARVRVARIPDERLAQAREQDRHRRACLGSAF